jgi:hypothetical protein
MTPNPSTIKQAKEGLKKNSISLRGALKLEPQTSSPIISAGSEFSIYVTIRNPFSIPISLYLTETHIPVELSDQIWKKRQNATLTDEREKIIKEKSTWGKIGLRLQYLWQDILGFLHFDGGPRVATAVTTAEYEKLSHEPLSSITVGRDFNNGAIKIGDNWDIHIAEDTNLEKVRKILWGIDEYKRGAQPLILNPGDSIVKHFVLKTTKWLMFTPISHTFQIQVQYEAENTVHIDTVPFTVNIRAAMGSSLIGSICGSVLGSLVSNSADFSNPSKLLQISLTSVIFGIIIVVAFARKSNVQQIISVEDFWGGLFIGFLVGYSGQGFIKSVLGNYQ